MKLEYFIKLFDHMRKPVNLVSRMKLEKRYPYYGAQGVIDYVDSYIFDGEYILLAEDGNNLSTLSKDIATYVKGKFWVNNHAHVLQTNNLMNQKYLYYLLNYIDIKSYITGSAQPKLNKENILSIEVNPPSLCVQRHIVNTISTLALGSL